MSFVASMLKTSTLLNGILDKNPGTLTLSELDRLQQYVNKGRSLVLLKEHPSLEAIIGGHALDNREEVVEMLLCFMEEGGKIGSDVFRRMVEGLVARGKLAPSVVEVLQNNKFLLPAPIPSTNLDGVAV